MNNQQNSVPLPQNMDPAQLERLLALAGQRLGVDPARLRRQLEQGAFGTAAKGLSPGQNALFQKVLQDPKAMEQLLQNPGVRQLLGQLMGGK